ncbi:MULTISPECIES: ABC transporter ATP-binding protein [Bradyrhizobium]|uniref:Peptide/nickel transport system ATP-binding protein n=2 Tax=Bradyrhizobium TaxID=374 RepID=A0ABY0PF10_9BRAD|nr:MULTISPECIES: ABC transporter ATP-binding protein [Bradyrhizobium]SDI20249.1 peptide/nickel transport system ATP-binding protein [Bradyrhizobium ottawaense]SED74380.1 peptide/nickel transport system ATP-binding protein [Bradyrhizobium lablabi]SHL70015.1 peptide/nickel transport system ATP-binding protein [Bradyrhizobium lablabi]
MTFSDRQNPVLEVRDLQVGFPNSIAVQGVSFAIAQGETMALVGESGCGKSLTAFSILRLLPPTASIIGGQVLFDGLDLATVSARKLRQIRGKGISIVLQEPMTSLNPVLTIGTQICEVILRHEKQSRRKAKDRVIELLDLVGISEPHRRYDQIPHNFSGGMRQRVMIAMAVACNPQLLIADEPTTALDVTIQAQVMDLLDRLRRQLSMAVLLITHDLGAVAQWADRVAVMYAGRIVEQASVSEFFAGPKHPYSQGLLSSAAGDGSHYTNQRLTEIKGSIASAAGESGCSFAPRCPAAVASCRAAPPTLETIGPGTVRTGWSVACSQLQVPGDKRDSAAFD